ncbi:nickel-binding protein [Rufibacter hautae]|uniref:DUF4242 domain-containing protein n=1 Tax=Rufibacter hautae TaxID=2595005 RepID=A0A5B6T8U1_9BACT|nr:nickel-binding protein [Rufibacter hautae]KAA3436337.1 DUF4242 domain-containing protein [Rufibacter hautae]
MALYMDRHDVPETVTAETVAHIHQEDLKLQDKYGCKVLTYWYDESRKNAFCLIEAPNAQAIQELHNEAHGQIPNSIIEVNAGLVESFLGRIDDPEKTSDTDLNIIDDSALRTIMMLVFKQLEPAASSASPERALMHHHKEAILKLLETYGGNLVKQTEDFFLVSFKSVSNAVHAAFDIQLALKDGANHADRKNYDFKIGLHAGLPVTEQKSIFEDTIKLAQRMCQVIKGEVVVSSEVKELYNHQNSESLEKEKRLFCLTQTDERFLGLLSDYLESQWSNTNLKIDDFSKPLGCSKSQLYRKMMYLTGKSPNSFIIEYRLSEALRLLNKNNSNVADIAYQTGFSSPSYFSKSFKKKYGHLPSDYLAVQPR